MVRFMVKEEPPDGTWCMTLFVRTDGKGGLMLGRWRHEVRPGEERHAIYCTAVNGARMMVGRVIAWVPLLETSVQDIEDSQESLREVAGA